MFIKITRATYLSGEAAAVGEIFEVDDATARASVEAKKAVIVEAPASEAVEPTKRTVKKFTGAKED